MCNSARHVVTGAARFALVMAFGLASMVLPARGQTVAELERRVDSLAERWRILAENARAADSIRRGAVTYDTIRQGPLTVIATSQWRSLLTQPAAYAASRLSEALGADTALLSGHSFFVVVRSRDLRVDQPMPEGANVVVISRDLRVDQSIPEGADLSSFRVSDWWEPEEIGNQLFAVSRANLTERLDEGAKAWLTSVPLEEEPERWYPTTYVEMVTAPSQAVRRCFLGELDACRKSIIPGVSDDPITSWYGPAERRLKVLQLGRQNDAALNAQRAACLVDDLDTQCEEFLRGLPSIGFLLPFSWPARQALVWTAIELGGDGAFARFLTRDSLSIEGRLSHAASASIDSVIATWRARILSAKPAPTLATPRTRWAALGWVVLFCLVAIRSTRWR